MTRIALLVAVLSLAAVPQDDASRETRNRLRTIRVDVDFTNWNVTQLADYLREITGLNIVVDSKAGAAATSLTMKAKGVTIQSVLTLLLKPNGVEIAIEDGVVILRREADAERKTRLEIIDVRDLLLPIRDFPGVDITLVTDGVGVAFSAVTDDTPPEFPLVDLVKAHVGGKSWEENPRASIQLMNGLLFVRQTPEVIAKVRALVVGLRRFK